MVAVLCVPETYPQSSCDGKHSSNFCKSLLVICQKRVAAQSMLSKRCPGKQHPCCVLGAFCFPRGHSRLSLRVVGVTHVLPGENWDPFLGRNRSRGRAWFTKSNFSWKTALESSPCCHFRFSSLLVPKLLFSLISFPKRSYYILQIRASDLKFLMPILFRPRDGGFPVLLISPHEAMAAIFSQLHHSHLWSCPDPMPCCRSLLKCLEQSLVLLFLLCFYCTTTLFPSPWSKCLWLENIWGIFPH